MLYIYTCYILYSIYIYIFDDIYIYYIILYYIILYYTILYYIYIHINHINILYYITCFDSLVCKDYRLTRPVATSEANGALATKHNAGSES